MSKTAALCSHVHDLSVPQATALICSSLQVLWAMSVCTLMACIVAAQDPPPSFDAGQAIYREQCLSCHGERGQGSTEHYDAPLHGDLSTNELARVIQETMPEGAPGSLSLEDASRVAFYVHHEFYSPMAQLRNSPPKVELTHLTTTQFRQSVLDLMSPFTGRPSEWKAERGLTRHIHQGDWGKDRKEIEKKVDGRLVWDWGEGKPVPEIDHEKWQIRWSGSLFAPTTGVYEFYLDATVRANLFVNDDAVPLIDASVVSFEKSLNTATIFLIGGHSYNLALDISRHKEPKARVAVEWKQPGGIRETIAERNLSPTWSPTALLCDTPFPPDDSSVGYERGSNISREWYEANIAAAIDIGNQLTSNLKRWMPRDANDPNNADAVKSWCHRWVSRAIRRPLSDDDKRHFVDSHFESDPSIPRAVKKVCLLTLTSPEFQYPAIAGTPDEIAAATLALTLWDSIPDEWMLQSAAKGEAHTEPAILAMADRMISDQRFQQKMRSFLHEFLGTTTGKELTKDSQKFPDFNERLSADLRTSLELFLDEFATDPAIDLRNLFRSDALYLNGNLAKHYGAELPADAPFQKIALPAGQRSGVLTHPLVMANLAYHNNSSPIHRGVFLAKRVLGRNLRPPVDAIIPIPEETVPGMNTRERVAHQTSGAMCQSCHRVINPLGFTMENYDAIGRFRTEELSRPIDSTGSYIAADGREVAFAGAKDLSDFLAASPEFHQALVRQLFQHFVKQPLPAFGLEKSAELAKVFADEGFASKPLMKKVAILATQRPIEPAKGEDRSVSLNESPQPEKP